MAVCFNDRSYCASPNCKNECGRKMTEKEKRDLERLNQPNHWDGLLGVCYGYFCGEPLKNESD